MIVVNQDAVAMETFLASMQRAADGMAPAQSWEPFLQELPSLTRGCVEEMTRLVTGHDAFDVLARVRQLFMMPLGPRQESATSMSIAVLDVVALVLLGLGLPPASGEPVVPAGRLAPALCEQAQRVLDLSMVASRAQTADLPGGFPDGMSELASLIRASEVQIRGRQYPSIASKINDSILRAPQVRAVMEEALGFTYGDAHAVDAAVSLSQ